jgi:uncharacterized protein YoxC
MKEGKRMKIKIAIIFLSVTTILLLGMTIFLINATIYARNTLNKDNKVIAQLKTDNKSLMSQVSDLNDDVTRKNNRISELLNKSEQASTTQAYTSQQEQSSIKETALPEEINPPNAVTIGSTKQHVREVMGTPTSMVAGGNYWWYGYASWISFDRQTGLVQSYSNEGHNLKIQ